MTQPSDARDAPSRRTAAGVLALACAAQFMVVLDVSVVNVALPSIQAELRLNAAWLPWAAGAYALAFGGFLLLGARLADLYGHRKVFTAGLALFTAASLAGGLAGSGSLLIAARAVQGLGAAVLAPITLTVLTTTFPEGPARVRALAIWTAVSLTGGAAGNLLGGALTQALSWRSILLINVPIGIVAAPAAARLLTATATAGRGRQRLDVPGALLATAGLTGLTFGISESRHGPGDPAALTALVVALACLAAFVLVEARYASAPLMPPRLLAARPIAIGNTVMLLAGACFQIPMWYFLTLYLQNVLRYSALQTGAAFLPHTLLTLTVGLQVTPRLMRRVDSRTLITAGALIAAAGFWWQSRITPDSTYLTGVLGPAILISVGGGLFNTPLTTTVTSGVPTADAGAASGLMNTAKQLGGVLGLAALTTLAPGTSTQPHTLTTGYGHAFLACAALLTAVAALARTLPVAHPTPSPPAPPPPRAPHQQDPQQAT
ncbi:MFS transporter [Actinomadura xylanilytica]|uniref:MFS transporter n=1 Tax=Actinomadura xylanilytica TaxID=887459 RepID=UPI00255ACA46|nr:MFS transporter [Actinomadura xylanilytica]MDL4776808.1 MFS transporter [Actinomadura xylanilytica]